MRVRSRLLAFVGSLLAASCAPPVARCAFDGNRRPAAGPGEVAFAVNAGPGAEELCIEARGTKKALGDLRASRSTASFVRDFAPASCDDDVCTLRYRFLLRAAADSFADRDTALTLGPVTFAPASTWLMHGGRATRDTRYRLAVYGDPAMRFVSGLAETGGTEGVYTGKLGEVGEGPYAAFGTLRVKRIRLPGGTIDLAMTPGSLGVSQARVERWVEQAARATASYYGTFPVPHLLILVLAGDKGSVARGTTMGTGGASIMIDVGNETDEEDLRDDWILVHELVHVSFPNVTMAWAEEGLATYVEPLIRVRAGMAPVDEVWRSLLVGLPQGLPEEGDKGLDVTDSWGRRYWGGALVWLLGDVAIRKETKNARGIDDALRAVLREGGNVTTTWTLERAFETSDRGAGVAAFMPLYREMGNKPVAVDLDALFARLGVRLAGGHVAYDDTAPEAWIRKAITAPPPEPQAVR